MCIEYGRSLKKDEILSAYFRYEGALYLSDVVFFFFFSSGALSIRCRVLNKLHPAHGLISMHNRDQ